MSEMNGTPSPNDVVRVLVNHFGGILIEQMTGATHADLCRWIEGGVLNVQQEARLRAGHQAFMTIAEMEGVEIARAWMFGMNPQLDDGNPMDWIGRDRYQEVLSAARTHINGDTFG